MVSVIPDLTLPASSTASLHFGLYMLLGEQVAQSHMSKQQPYYIIFLNYGWL